MRRLLAALLATLLTCAAPAQAQMVDSWIQVPTDGSGKRVDSSQKSVGGNTVYDQRYNFCDPVNDVCNLLFGPGAALFTSSNDTAIKSNATITASGSQVVFVGSATEVDVTTNIKASPTGTTPTLTVSVQDVDPGDQTTVLNTALTGATLNAIATQQLDYISNSSWIKVSWVVTGTTPSFTQTYITLTAKTEPTTIKGVQLNGAVPTQDLKDSGRTYVNLYYDRITGITTEALATMTINKAGSTTTGTSYTVTTGKTLRCVEGDAEILNTTTTANRTITRWRSAASVSATSPIVLMVSAMAPVAAASDGWFSMTAIPDGFEIAGGQQIGVSHLENITTAGIASSFLHCFEY